MCVLSVYLCMNGCARDSFINGDLVSANRFSCCRFKQTEMSPFCKLYLYSRRGAVESQLCHVHKVYKFFNNFSTARKTIDGTGLKLNSINIEYAYTERSFIWYKNKALILLQYLELFAASLPALFHDIHGKLWQNLREKSTTKKHIIVQAMQR